MALGDHLEHVADAATALAAELGLPPADRDPLVTAARWHDVGKAHPAFQARLLRHLPADDAKRRRLWAKSGPAPPAAGGGATDDPGGDGKPPQRLYSRDELASASTGERPFDQFHYDHDEMPCQPSADFKATPCAR